LRDAVDAGGILGGPGAVQAPARARRGSEDQVERRRDDGRSRGLARFHPGLQQRNDADNYGITPLMVAANLGDTKIIQYLVDQGADLAAYDLGKKNDGAFGASV